MWAAIGIIVFFYIVFAITTAALCSMLNDHYDKDDFTTWEILGGIFFPITWIILFFYCIFSIFIVILFWLFNLYNKLKGRK